MNDAKVQVPRLLAFIALCVVIGPAIGIMGILAQLSLATIFDGSGAFFSSSLDFRFVSLVLFFGYLLGAPVALVAALIFATVARLYGRHGLASANLAAIIAAIVLTAVALNVSEHGYYVPQWRLFRMMIGTAAMALTSVIAMTACWCMARAIRILRQT